MSRELVRSAVVWRTGALGDFVLTLPVLDALRERAEHLTVIAPSRYRALFAEADQWIDADGSEALALLAGRCPLDAEVGLAWGAIPAQTLKRAGVGTVHRGEPHPPPHTHQVDSLWSPLASWLGPRDRVPQIRAVGVDAPTNAIVIAPGSGGLRKRWPVAHWQRVTRDRPATWISGPDERDHGAWPVRPRTDLDLAGLVGLARSCSVWLGPDAGPQHLAAACGTTVGVVFTGTTDPRQWCPVGATPFVNPDVATVRSWMLSALDGAPPEGPDAPRRD